MILILQQEESADEILKKLYPSLDNSFVIKIIREEKYTIKNGIEISIEQHPQPIQTQKAIQYLIPKGISQAEVINVFQIYLSSLSIDDELIIIDPFFFPLKADSNYSSLIVDILKPHLRAISILKIITNKHFNKTISAEIITGIKSINPPITLVHKQSQDYHDRYWISGNREKGIIIGTSMNGLGKKYALISDLITSDVKEIISALISDSMI